ncbi:MAG: hypothetical protein IPI60_01495 [Saprospiraceae bacterium]|nr:hypothetical protein [Saprospiraceae bacterium]
MDIKKLLLSSILLVFAIQVSLAKEPPAKDPQKEGQGQLNDQISYRSDCAVARAQTDQAINNVRARLTTGGDVWRNGNDGGYVVPKPVVGSGVLGVSSIFAGAVWLGGYDPFDNLKVAAQTFRSQTSNDFWPGPLNEEGQTEKQECARWDKFFKVLGENITTHIRGYQAALATGSQYDEELIPNDVLGWPGFGNPHFERLNGFPLPNTSQGLAGFHDEDGDGAYDPVNGDYPIIEIRGCPEPQYPDEMIFWIYNDAGNIHTSSRGFPIQMEVQVQAFAYKTNDEINDMTFQRYKLINRATDIIERTYFAMWVDPDLGCYQDDYVGCDSTRSLMYVYNEDQVDGLSGCDCAGTPTYCTNVPILGVDYFRGPLDRDVLDSLGNPTEIGMSSFVYYNNGGIGGASPATADPSQAIEYYRYLSGFWRDGTPITLGGTGYNVGSTQTVKYVFPDGPNSQAATAWSMCSSNLSFGDRRTVQASGPFRLRPGDVNELIIGVVWLPSQRYPCPSIAPLQAVDDIAQALFDNCFEITDGPDAPDMCFVELDREIIGLLTNDAFSNNYLEAYEGKDLQAPAGIEDSVYRFEGYKVYQLRSSEVGPAELNNPDKARLVYQADKRNGINTLYNWMSIEDPNENTNIFIPEIQVEGADVGISHSFRLTEDQFALTDKTLINHKKYYYTVVAYAFNDYEYAVGDTTKIGFDASTGVGQRRTYLEGRNNVNTYTVIPRPIIAEYTNARYGDGVQITRLDGKGNYGAFLQVEDGVYDSILDGTFTGEIPYKKGGGPLNVKVVNPLEVRDAELELRMYNTDGSTTVNAGTRWFVTDTETGEEVYSDLTMASLNEQIMQDYGVSITLGPVDVLGSRGTDLTANESNGAVGASIEYADPENPWFSGVPDTDAQLLFIIDPNTGLPRGIQPLNYIKNAPSEPDFALDPTQRLQRIGEGIFSPMFIQDFRFTATDFLISPMMMDNDFGASVRGRINPALTPNVDIILTSDKSKWSRCVVVQTASPHYYGAQGGFSTADGTESFDYRKAPSVNKDGVYATSDGTFGGTRLTTISQNPDDPNYLAPLGMGWFPGYAIDVECGTRVNIFFGENSAFDESYQSYYDNEKTITNDMLWNPSSQLSLEGEEIAGIPQLLFFLGGQHHIYVTKQVYDGCAFIHSRLDPARNALFKRTAFDEFAWAGIPLLLPGTELLPLAQGLIPNDAIIKLRVNSQYRNECASSFNGGLPAYRIKINGLQTKALDEIGIENALDAINVVPNPYYGYSSYEISQFTNTVKITNLPDKCTVTIYSMDGKFIKQYNRNESPMVKTGSNPGSRTMQTVPDLEWDMRNNKNIPIASGVYLIHVNAGDMGERVIKWFGVNRQFDPSGL